MYIKVFAYIWGCHLNKSISIDFLKIATQTHIKKTDAIVMKNYIKSTQIKKCNER